MLDQPTAPLKDGGPIRSIRNERYRYIRNLTPEVAFRNIATNHRPFPSWIQAAKNGDSQAVSLVRDYQHRPAEELYDCETDPWNRHNLIDNKALAPVVTNLKQLLDAWMKSQGDEGQATEEMALTRMPRKQADANAD